MIKIKNFIFNENEIEFIEELENGIKVCPKTFNVKIREIENATFEDIEWNYDSTQKRTLNNTILMIDELTKKNTELEEELEKEKKAWKDMLDNWERQTNKIGKAIEFIKNNADYDEDINRCVDDLRDDDCDDLLKILKGEK